MRLSYLCTAMAVLLTAPSFSQNLVEPVANRTPQIGQPTAGIFNHIAAPYQVHDVMQVNFQNSPRIFDLIQGGQLYLSFEDAIAIALENNLDIELQRFLPRIADTDLLRAQGGGTLRGFSLLVNEPPPGIGGPDGPLLTNLTAGSTPSPLVNSNFSDIALISEQQNDLSVTGATPFASGPAIPQFDPIVSASLTGQHQSTTEYSAVLTGSNWLVESGVNGNAGVTVGFASGAQLNATFENSWYSSQADRYTYNGFANSSLGFTITQPLLQGFGTSLNKRYIRIARNSLKVADLVFRQQVMDTVAGITRLYTDLVSLNEDVLVKQEAVRLAQRLSEDTRHQVEQGTQAPIEVTRANASLAASRQALINAEGLVRQQELILKTALTRRGLDNPLVLEAHIVPTDPLVVPEREQFPPVPALVTEALRNRPDMEGAGIQVENTQIGLRGSLNAVKPQLNLVGSVVNSGLAGNPNAQAPGPVGGVSPGGIGSALGQVFRRDYPSYSIGIQLVLPVRNRVAQADAVRDELQVRQAQVRRQALEDQIRLEVADAEESLREARAAYDAAVEARRLQEQSVNVEQQSFGVGFSTNLQVIQYENFLAQARSTEVASKAAYVKARIALQRATGTILDDTHVSIDEARRGSVARSEKKPRD